MAPTVIQRFLILESDFTLQNEKGRFKANIVLAKILAVLVLIPDESHSESRQDSVSVETKDVNTFVCTVLLRARPAQIVVIHTTDSKAGKSARLSGLTHG